VNSGTSAVTGDGTPHWSRAVSAALGAQSAAGWYALFDREGRCIDRSRRGIALGQQLLRDLDGRRLIDEVCASGRSAEQQWEFVDARLGPRSFDVVYQPLKQADDVLGVLVRSTERTGRGTRTTLHRLHAGLLETIQDGLLLTDPQGSIRLANPAAERLLAREGRRLVGTNIDSLDPVAAEAIDTARGLRDMARWGWTEVGPEGRVLDCRSQVVTVGQQPFVLTLLSDVTEATRLRQKRDQMTRDLHDGLGQDLTGLSLMLRHLERTLAPEQPAQRDTVESMLSIVRQMLDDTRAIAQGGTPSRIPLSQLPVALDQLARRSAARAGIDVQCRSTVTAALPASEAIGTNLYRIAQEATTNALRHAGAAHIRIEFDAVGALLQLTIDDDGCGFEPLAAANTGAGLTNLRNRAAAIGAELDIAAAPGGGCRVSCRLDMLRESAPSTL
jgi:signal transduction histidine kinase